MTERKERKCTPQVCHNTKADGGDESTLSALYFFTEKVELPAFDSVINVTIDVFRIHSIL